MKNLIRIKHIERVYCVTNVTVPRRYSGDLQNRERARRPVSRVLSLPSWQRMTIHLGCPLPDTSCDQPEPSPRRYGARVLMIARVRFLCGLAPSGVFHAAPVARGAVRSCRTFSPLLAIAGLAVRFLWHFPWGRPRRTLSGTFSPGARTFLPTPASGSRAAIRPSGQSRLTRVQ